VAASIAHNANAAAIKSAIVTVDDGITASDVDVTGSGGCVTKSPDRLRNN
jgi:hypothetical protein